MVICLNNSLIVGISDKDLKVMEVLFEYRGMEMCQILFATGYGVGGRNNMYKTFNRLLDKRMIGRQSLASQFSGESLRRGNTGMMYFLTAKGYSYMLSYFGIPIEHIGVGYNKDYGDFDYTLAKPPTRYVTRHLMVVDTLLSAREFQKNVDGENPLRYSFDFRDNRYASRRFSIEVEDEGAKPFTKKMNLRPAAELLINSESYFVEVDLNTKRAEKIDSKFEGYKAYFDYLTENCEPLPAGIIFVSEKLKFFNAKQRRWQTITNSFYRVLEKYACKVKLMYESVDMLHEVFAKEYYADKRNDN